VANVATVYYINQQLSYMTLRLNTLHMTVRLAGIFVHCLTPYTLEWC